MFPNILSSILGGQQSILNNLPAVGLLQTAAQNNPILQAMPIMKLIAPATENQDSQDEEKKNKETDFMKGLLGLIVDQM